MVKEAKFYRKQADKAEAAARASSDAQVSEGLLAMAQGYRHQAALIKKRQKAKPKAEKAPKKASEKISTNVRSARKRTRSKRRP